MGFFNKIFGGESNTSGPDNSQEKSGWHFSENTSMRMHQMVIPVPAGIYKESRFDVMLLAAKYQLMLINQWTTGFFRMDDDAETDPT